jgi:hypothetical protein
VIVRILGEGQLRLPDGGLPELGELDDELANAVSAGDEARFREALTTLLDQVRAVGQPLAPDELKPSDLVLPAADAALNEVKKLLEEEGLIS